MTKKISNGKTELDKKLLFLLDESIPITQTERKKYMSDIAFFYSSIFKSKLQHFIGMQLEELAKIGRTEELNNIFRANVNCFRLIDKWMEKMTNEHIGNIETIRRSLDTDENFINSVKDKYEN